MSEALVFPADAAARIAALEASLARANAALAARDLLIDTLRGQIARLRRMQFGASSEKLGREIEQLELALEELETERDAPVPGEIAPGVEARPVPVRSLPGHLPREEIVHEPVSGACTCPDCGGALRPLGSDAHEMLDIVPVRWRVVRDVRPKYSCRMCEKIVQAPTPVSAVARGKATFSTLAHIVVSKFDHHLPLYRQAEMMAAQGLDIDRSTLAGWAGQAAALLDPIVSRIRDEVLKADKIHADDTPMPVLDPGRGKTATGRLWVYAADERASSSTAPRATWYRFTPDRTAAHPLAHLAGFRGFLQADAYAGYDGLYRSGVTEVACWAHFRRKVFDLHERVPFRRHSAHVGHDVVVWYRWHPYFERTVRCEYTEERANGRVAHIVVSPGEVIVVPAWMLDREVCAAFSLGSPQVAVDALIDLHGLLIDADLRNALLSGLNAQEVNDEDLAPTNAAAGAAPVDHAARHEKPGRSDESPARRRGGKPSQVVDGGRRRLGRGGGDQ